jgi:hypothetical protein
MVEIKSAYDVTFIDDVKLLDEVKLFYIKELLIPGMCLVTTTPKTKRNLIEDNNG